jgi:hypothetical protein
MRRMVMNLDVVRSMMGMMGMVRVMGMVRRRMMVVHNLGRRARTVMVNGVIMRVVVRRDVVLVCARRVVHLLVAARRMMMHVIERGLADVARRRVDVLNGRVVAARRGPRDRLLPRALVA